MKKALVLVIILTVVSGLVFAGGNKEQGGTAQPQQGSQSVSVLAVWGGQELDAFRQMIKPFEDQTGITVQYEGTRDIDAVLTTRVQAGNPP